MFYRVIFLATVSLSSINAMQREQSPLPSKPSAPIDHFTNRLDRLVRQDKGNEIISMYEEHPERRGDMREFIQQKKPLLLQAFDAIEQAERKQHASQQNRDAFDVLNDQHQQNFQQEFERVQKAFQTTGSIKPAEELAKQCRSLAAPKDQCTALDLFIARSKALSQRTMEPLLDFQRSHRNLSEKEQKEWQQIFEAARQELAAPSAPEMVQPPVREPDAHYQDILIPQVPTPRPIANGQSIENEAVARFLQLSPEQKEAVLEDLIKKRDVITLRVLKQQLPGFKKIDEALELIEVMRKSAHESQQPQPAGKKLNKEQKPVDAQDSDNSLPGMMRNVRNVVVQNPVESAVVATTVVGLIAYAWRKSRSD
jgi:hypothetical protein